MSKISESWPFSNRHDASMPSMECEALGIMGRHDVGYQVGRRIMRGDYRQNDSIQLCNSVGPFYRFTVLLYYYESSSFGNIVILRQYRHPSALPSLFCNIVIRQHRHSA